MTAATLLAVVHLASAQGPCDLPTAIIDRLKIEMAETPTLPSGQLFVKVGNANPTPFERAQGSPVLDRRAVGLGRPDADTRHCAGRHRDYQGGLDVQALQPFEAPQRDHRRHRSLRDHAGFPRR